MEENKDLNTKNPTRKEAGLSIQQLYEQKHNNFNDYSTETFERLELGEDQVIQKNRDNQEDLKNTVKNEGK